MCRVVIDDVLAVNAESVQHFTVNHVVTVPEGATQIDHGLGVGALRIVGQQRIGSQEAQPRTGLPRPLDRRYTQFTGALHGAFDVISTIVLRSDKAGMATRIDGIERQPLLRTPEPDQLIAAAP